MVKFNLDNETVKKVGGVVSAIAMGLIAVGNALSDQKKAKEFEEMKKTLSELQNK